MSDALERQVLLPWTSDGDACASEKKATRRQKQRRSSSGFLEKIWTDGLFFSNLSYNASLYINLWTFLEFFLRKKMLAIRENFSVKTKIGEINERRCRVSEGLLFPLSGARGAVRDEHFVAAHYEATASDTRAQRQVIETC